MADRGTQIAILSPIAAIAVASSGYAAATYTPVGYGENLKPSDCATSAPSPVTEGQLWPRGSSPINT